MSCLPWREGPRPAFFPRWIKKSSSLSVSLRRLISPKSEQINHLEKNEGGFASMCGAPFYGCVTRSVCTSAFVSVHPCFVCRRVTASMFVHVSVCMTVNMRVNRRHEEADGYFSIGGGGGLARGSMIKTLNQTPCSNIIAESCNFNFFRPVDTN